MAEEESEYESDPEEAKLSLKMRRREASDEEEEEEMRRENPPPRRIDDSDEEESIGAAADYEDELEEEDYDLDEEYVEVVEEDVEVYEEIGGVKGGANKGELVEEEKKGVNDSNKSNGASEIDDENDNVADGQNEEEKKEMEPYAVPTAGAFYMHDDRFRDNARGRGQRRMRGGRKLWESKDDRKWGHDKFEELTLQERHHDEHRRGSRGLYRGRGRNRGSDRGHARGSRPKEYTNNSTRNHNNQNNAPNGVRGRGPRRYQPSFKNNNEVPFTQSKQSGKSVEKANRGSGKSVEKRSYISSVRNCEPTPNGKADMVPRKQAVASNLSIASPPFYPSGSSGKDNITSHKRDVQAGTINRDGQPSAADKSFTIANSSAMRGKNIVDSIDMGKLHIDDSLSAGRPSLPVPLSGTPSINSTQARLRGHGRGATSLTKMAYQQAVSSSQVNRVPSPNQLQNVQRNPGQSRAQYFSQQFTRVDSGAQASSPPKGVGVVNTFKSGELKSSSESSKSKSALVAKEKGIMQSNGMGSFLYDGAQVMGTSGIGRGDQNFPAFLPVMQFGGQHPGGIGVPAVGMAFPGYVGQPQLGGRSLGNSEMTWLPVLAGAAGALGANFCPPYITVDGSYHARPPGEASIAVASSKENSATQVGDDWKHAQKPELTNDDGQRQKNPRRYTEMKFDQ